uniref:Conserved domain protein n=1 Tax=Steinernema glaseri TaxID=37863 RepID=A0A1I7Y751_9BILA
MCVVLNPRVSFGRRKQAAGRRGDLGDHGRARHASSFFDNTKKARTPGKKRVRSSAQRRTPKELRECVLVPVIQMERRALDGLNNAQKSFVVPMFADELTRV